MMAAKSRLIGPLQQERPELLKFMIANRYQLATVAESSDLAFLHVVRLAGQRQPDSGVDTSMPRLPS